jgi:hypothetical protein
MKNPRTILLTLVVVAALGAVGYLVYQYVSLRNDLNDPNYLINLQVEQQSNTRERIMSRLSSIMLLPDETNPKIATISNIEDLKKENPEFYKNSVNGDTLVLYSELAIIYRDSLNKIINIAPILKEN